MAIEPGPQFNPEDMGIDKEEQENMEMRGKLGAMADSGDDMSHILGARLATAIGSKKFYSQMVNPTFYIKHNLNLPEGVMTKVGEACDTFENSYHPLVKSAGEAHEIGNSGAALKNLMDAHRHLQNWHSTLVGLLGPNHPAISHLGDTVDEHAEYVANYGASI